MKIKIVSFCSVVALCASITSWSQGAQIRAGVNMANISVTENGRVDEANALTSFQVGIVGDIALGKVVSFQPGLLFTGKGAKLQNGDPSMANWYRSTFNPYYLEIPANLVFKLPLGTNRFFVGAGPYIAMGIAGKRKLEGATLGVGYTRERDIEFSNDDPTTFSNEEGTGFGVVRRFDYGLNGTAGVEGKTIVLAANYGLGLAKLQSGSNNSVDNNDKHRVFSVTLGFKF
jgi:hypothetical protein